MSNFKEILPSLDDLIVQIVEERLEYFKGNQSKAATSLQMSRNTFRKYMKLSPFIVIKKGKIYVNIISQ